jgi:DnaJ family protein A protein 2
MKRTTEVLEVNVDKGATDGHKITFHNKADEIPDGDAGDVVFVLKEKPHDVFKRHGADLYIERSISLVEALCGFTMEIKKLDGRTLVMKTKPGDVTNITTFDPFKADVEETGWEVFDGYDCELEDMAQADSNDVDMLKKAVSKGQLKGKGIGCFVVSGGRTTFKRGTRDECLAKKTKETGSVMYVLEDGNKSAGARMLRAVEGEGLPLVRDPFQFGNLFLQLNIEFPTELSEEAQAALRSVLPAGTHESTADETAEDVDTHEITLLDPVKSFKDGTFSTKDANDSDDEEGGAGGQRVQCAQQ